MDVPLVFSTTPNPAPSQSQSSSTPSIKGHDDSPPWCFTGFYGELDTSKRQTCWDLLIKLVSQSPQAWLVAGDFDEIFEQLEKCGRLPHPAWQLRDFHLALDNAVFDLGYSGYLFTWCNRREGPIRFSSS
ncbi:UNVERIFIED_CONTAM: hypothetical protein Sradi_3171800 [Sesamum radiatum]|uniref:Uncharacterized protein n=1 Tax=Sesamum radiatum TaxID=300843 RepID=A0AAW2RGU3_SESRA